jgi:osmotically-inducible protein OsmY
MGKGPQGWNRSKERIMEDICERMAQHGQLDASNIQVNVNDGQVALSGHVNSRREKRIAEDVAESVWGVNDVNNQIRVAESMPNEQRAAFERDK